MRPLFVLDPFGVFLLPLLRLRLWGRMSQELRSKGDSTTFSRRQPASDARPWCKTSARLQSPASLLALHDTPSQELQASVRFGRGVAGWSVHLHYTPQTKASTALLAAGETL